MAREILFKAKRTDNGEWVHGNYINGGFIIKMNHTECIDIDNNTLCQYTGLTDKNGKLIWENDILNRGNLVVTWKEELASYCLTKKGWMYQHFFGEAVDACD